MDNVIKYLAVGFLCLCVGFGLGYVCQPAPVVEIKAKLTPPFVEVIVNGKIYDANHLKVVPVPAPKKGWWGEEKPAAQADTCPCGDNCQCGDCKCAQMAGVATASFRSNPASPSYPALFQVEDRSKPTPDKDQASLFSGILKELLAWVEPRYNEAAKALAERERLFGEKCQWIGIAAVVALLLLVIPMWSLAISQAKIASK